jgi:glutamyl-tRNA reductase
MTTAIGTATVPPRPDSAQTLIAALRTRAEAIRREELASLDGRWDGLCADDRRRLEVLTQRIVEALLREPTRRLRAAGHEGGESIASARFLFALESRGDSAVRTEY